VISPYVKRIVFDGAPEEDAKRQMRGLRSGMRDATKKWQREMAPQHFKFGAQGRYGYQQRTKKYRRRKERVYGHRRPLVYSGETLKWVTTRFAQPTTRKTPLGVASVLPVVVPKYFFMYRGAGPDKYAELTTTLPDEYEALFQVVDKALDEAMDQRTRKRRVSVGNA